MIKIETHSDYEKIGLDRFQVFYDRLDSQSARTSSCAVFTGYFEIFAMRLGQIWCLSISRISGCENCITRSVH